VKWGRVSNRRCMKHYERIHDFKGGFRNRKRERVGTRKRGPSRRLQHPSVQAGWGRSSYLPGKLRWSSQVGNFGLGIGHNVVRRETKRARGDNLNRENSAIREWGATGVSAKIRAEREYKRREVLNGRDMQMQMRTNNLFETKNRKNRRAKRSAGKAKGAKAGCHSFFQLRAEQLRLWGPGGGGSKAGGSARTEGEGKSLTKRSFATKKQDALRKRVAIWWASVDGELGGVKIMGQKGLWTIV